MQQNKKGKFFKKKTTASSQVVSLPVMFGKCSLLGHQILYYPIY